MSYEHKPEDNFEEVEGHQFEYSCIGNGMTNTYKGKGFAGFGERNDSVFYIAFEDCKSESDEEGFLLLCSEVELKELVNHLRMIRGV